MGVSAMSGMEIKMKKRKTIRKYAEYILLLLLLAVIALTATAVTGCGSGPEGTAGMEAGTEMRETSGAGTGSGAEEKSGTAKDTPNDGKDGTEGQEGKSGLVWETAADGHVDFDVLQKENPDIFAWLYVPGTGIDAPILQSPVSDDYYQSHRADGREGTEGALYTEMPNMMDMCDFNTIIHGKDDKDGGLFAGLHKFEDPDFFEENEKFYIYLPDNVLTYEIFAAYYDEESDILRRFDYTTYGGCAAYLEQVYGARDMGKNQREGWDDLTPYHFLVTLDGSIREEEGRQYVVIGALVGDAAGKIDRVIFD